MNQSVRNDIKLAGDLALEAFYAAEEARVFDVYLLRLLLGEDQDLLSNIIKEVHLQARDNVNRLLHEAREKTKKN